MYVRTQSVGNTHPKLFFLLLFSTLAAEASCFARLKDQINFAYMQLTGSIDTKTPYRSYVETAKPSYTKSGGFLKWGNNLLPFQGWKFHITCDSSNMAHIMSLLPELRKRNIKHKIIESEEFYNSWLSDPNKENRGKFLTIYPKDEAEASELALWINGKIEEMNVNKSDSLRALLLNSNLSTGDLPLGKSGLFYARYGKLQGHIIEIDRRKYVEAFVNGRRHVVPFRPQLEYQVIDPTGMAIPDSRDAVPQWVEVPEGIQSLRAK